MLPCPDEAQAHRSGQQQPRSPASAALQGKELCTRGQHEKVAVRRECQAHHACRGPWRFCALLVPHRAIPARGMCLLGNKSLICAQYFLSKSAQHA